VARYEGWSEEELEARSTALAELLKQVWAAIAALISTSIVKNGTVTASDATMVQTQWAAHAAPVLTAVAQAYLDSAGDVLEVVDSEGQYGIELIGEDLVAMHVRESANRLRDVSNDVWQNVREAIVAGINAGESVAQVAARVQEITGVSEGRALTIARTEIHRAHEAGTLDQAMFVDPNATKEWLATDDERTRPTHRAVNGKKVKVSEPFQVGAALLMAPGVPLGALADPGEIINCRCSTAYDFDIITEESSDQGTEEPVTDETPEPGALSLIAAARKWKPEDHPRGKDGKFIKKGAVQALLSAKKPLINQVADAVDNLTPEQWSNLKDEQQDYIKESVEKLPKQSQLYKQLKSKLESVALDTSNTPKTSPIPAHKGAPPGSPIKVTTTLVWGKYEPDTVIAEHPESGQRVVWNGKQYDVQSQLSTGEWATMSSYNKKSFYQQFKNDQGWVVPGADVPEKSEPETEPPTPTSSPPPPPPPSTFDALPTVDVDGSPIWSNISTNSYMGDVPPNSVVAESGEFIKLVDKGNNEFKIVDTFIEKTVKDDIDGDQLEEVATVWSFNWKALDKPQPLNMPEDDDDDDDDDDEDDNEDVVESQGASAAALGVAKLGQFLKQEYPPGTVLAVSGDDKHRIVAGEFYKPDNTMPVAIAKFKKQHKTSSGDWVDTPGKSLNTLQALKTLINPDAKWKVNLDAKPVESPPTPTAATPDVPMPDLKAVWESLSEFAPGDVLFHGKMVASGDQARLVVAKGADGKNTLAFQTSSIGKWITIAKGSSALTNATNSSFVAWSPNPALAEKLKSLSTAPTSVLTPTPVLTPSAVDVPPVASPTVVTGGDISNVPDFVKKDIKDLFKQEKVGYWSKPEKIWETIKKAQADYQDPHNPGHSKFTPLQIIKILDSQLKTKEPSPFEKKMTKWAGSKKGAAYVGSPAGLEVPTPQPQAQPDLPSSPSPVAPPSVPKLENPAVQVSVGSDDISGLTSEKKSQLYKSFKSHTNTFLTSPPAHIFNALKTVADDNGLSIMQVIKVVDEVGAEKVKASNQFLFQKKITDWLGTKQGAAYVSGAAKSAALANQTPKFAPNIDPKTSIPSFEKSSTYTYKVITPVRARELQYYAETLYQSEGGSAITSKQRTQANLYTGSAYIPVNNYLNGVTDTISPTYATMANDIQSMMRPSVQAMLLVRAVQYDGFANAHSHEDIEKTVGQTWMSGGFVSTSVGGKIAPTMKGKPVKLEIEAPPGTPMVWLKDYRDSSGAVKALSAWPTENEMLLAAGLSYRVINVKRINGQTVVRLRVVPEEPTI
jgi:SPP1 gp7 family putative phage head morphogenesis protein